MHFCLLILPSSDIWLKRLLDSYCEFELTTQHWKIKPHEKNIVRQDDIQEIRNIILKMGNFFGFSVQIHEEIIQWKDHTNAPDYRFFITNSSILTQFSSEFLNHPQEENVILYPGSRAELLAFKNKHNLIYQSYVKDIHFVKFRHIRQLNKTPDLTVETWQEKIDSDPAEWKIANQLSMF